MCDCISTHQLGPAVHCACWPQCAAGGTWRHLGALPALGAWALGTPQSPPAGTAGKGHAHSCRCQELSREADPFHRSGARLDACADTVSELLGPRCHPVRAAEDDRSKQRHQEPVNRNIFPACGGRGSVRTGSAAGQFPASWRSESPTRISGARRCVTPHKLVCAHTSCTSWLITTLHQRKQDTPTEKMRLFVALAVALCLAQYAAGERAHSSNGVT